MRSIAGQLHRSPSTVSREIKRNGGYDQYRAAIAEQAIVFVARALPVGL